MFSVEIRINSQLIAHISGRNIAGHHDGECKYAYQYYEPEEVAVVTGEIIHNRPEGLRKLIQIILDDVETQLKEK